MRVAADETGDDMFLQVGGHGQFTPVDGGIADAVDAGVGLKLERDEIAPRSGDDDAGSGDFHGREVL